MLRPLFLILLLALTADGQAATAIRVGLNYPSTGNYKSEGLELRRGALLAIDEHDDVLHLQPHVVQRADRLHHGGARGDEIFHHQAGLAGDERALDGLLPGRGSRRGSHRGA